jgi:hypothetical protein
MTPPLSISARPLFTRIVPISAIALDFSVGPLGYLGRVFGRIGCSFHRGSEAKPPILDAAAQALP